MAIPSGGHAGDLLAKRTDDSYDVEWITPAPSAEEDNTKPLTSDGLYILLGDIHALQIRSNET